MNDSNLLHSSATQLAALIRQKQVSSLQAVDAHIAHAQKVNPHLNAIVAERYELARAEAKAADEKIARGSVDENREPLLGVPCTVKESIGLLDAPFTSGLASRRGVLAEADATVVERIRKAGAIPIGSTNISELCMWMESNNTVYGRTNNAYSEQHTAGGSSGGEGAAVGAGIAPFGIGADIGGSIRLPAYFNGVFGHKATGGRVPNTGQFPIAEGQALRMLTTGPLARRAEDLPLLMRIMWGPDGVDEACENVPLRDAKRVDVSKLNVVVIDSNGRLSVDRDVRDGIHKAADHLQSIGCQVREIKIDALRHSMEIWAAVMQNSHAQSYEDLLCDGKGVSILPEFFRALLGKSPYTLPSLGLCLIERVMKRLPEQKEKFLSIGKELRQTLVEEIGENGVLLYPPYPSVAPRHNKALMIPIYWMYTAVMNAMELPVTQVPLGLNAQGLPLGVQVVATHDNDHLTMAVALELERTFGGWVMP